MRITFLSVSGQLGGAEWSLLDRIAGFRESYPDWPLSMIAGAEGPLVERVAALGVDVRVLPLPGPVAALGDSQMRRGGGGRRGMIRSLAAAAPAALRHVQRLRSLLAELDPQVVSTFGLKMHILGSWAAPRGVPVIWNMQDYVSTRAVMARLLRVHSRRASAAVCCSRSVSEDVRGVCGPGFPVHTVYNMVDLDRFSPEGPAMDMDERAGLPAAEENVVRIGLVGTLARWKGHETFLRALALLPRELPVRGYVVGGALYQTSGSQHSLEELRALASGLGVADRVGFTGFTDRPADAIRGVDVVVHASTLPEPFGRVIAEAMACGRAVVAADAGGAAELVVPGVDALIHTPGDPGSLAAQLERLVREPGLRERLGRGGMDTARSRFDRRNLAPELAPIYRATMIEAA